MSNQQEQRHVYELIESDRLRLSNFIEKRYGIQMPASKKILLQSRLQKRALHLGHQSLHEYVDYLFGAEGQTVEIDQFATIVSTHKTEFYREAEHFSILKEIILPELFEHKIISDRHTLVAWSSASSTGEEVYSIAMLMYDYYKKHGYPGNQIKVIGTDISDNIVDFARKGIYSATALPSIPHEYHPYIMRSRNPKRHEIRIVPEVRALTDFRPQNLMDAQYKVKKGIHIIFCRNVLIYFNRSTQEMILRRLVAMLAPGGFLLIGHSESLSGLDLPLEQVKMTVFRKIGECA